MASRERRIERYRGSALIAAAEPGTALTVLQSKNVNPFVAERPEQGRVMRALVAAAKRIQGTKLGRMGSNISWQDEAYALYDQIGELRFVTNSIASALSGCELYIGEEDPDGDGYNRLADREHPANQALAALWGDTPTAQSEMLRRIGQHLFVAGESWLVGYPEADAELVTEDDAEEYLPPTGIRRGTKVLKSDGMDLDRLTWSAHARGELKKVGEQIQIDDRKVDVGDVVFIRIWRPHPRKASEADSPVRSSMPVCRELVGLTMHVSATIDSRLAGAGLLVVPQSATLLGVPSPEEGNDPETFLDTLATHMITPIKDRDVASAVVPIVAQVPDEATGQFHHITFATPLDATAQSLREEAIRRLALGLDAPPERLLGMGQANHWGAWQLSEDEVKLHIQPLLNLIRDTLTTMFLRVVLQESGVTAPETFVVMSDVSGLTLRPDRSQDAFQLHDRKLITDEAMRSATGFGPEDAPKQTIEDPALRMALEWCSANSQLLIQPGLANVVEQIKAALEKREPVLPEAGPVEPEISDLDRMLAEAEAKAKLQQPEEPAPPVAPEPVDPNAPGGTVQAPPRTQGLPAPSTNSAPIPGASRQVA